MGIARNIAPQFGVQVANITVGAGYVVPIGARLSHSANSEDFPDPAGETLGQYFWNHKLSGTIEVYPAGSSAANANAASVLASVFKPGKVVTLVSDDADLNTAFVVKSAEKSKSTSTRTMITAEIERFTVHGTNIAANEITV